ncbi:MAG: twin-arginine translocase subunit TatC [Candidatus Omnitrophica bacterium]|nr:twin-arginine translocase subunit TatC [Candidatus Omnitrophota bacterium]
MKSKSASLTFLDHLDELRGRVVQFLFIYLVCCIFAYNLTSSILPYLIKPVGAVVFNAPGEAFAAYMILTLLVGLVISMPFLLYHIWAFAWEALTEKERKYIVIFGPLSLVFFLAGGAFAYFVVVPIAVKFLMSFSSPYVVPMIGIQSYISFLGSFLLSFGIVFELPLILVFLVKIGVATPAFLRQFRKHSILGVLILSALLTPPDVVSQLLMAVPLILLYELGILFSVLSYKEKI